MKVIQGYSNEIFKKGKTWGMVARGVISILKNGRMYVQAILLFIIFECGIACAGDRTK